MKHVDLYFDFVSPYPWLASHQLSELRGCTAAKFCFVPVLSAALLDHHSNMGPASIGYATTPATFSVQSSGTRAWLVAVALIRAGLNSLISNSLTQRECVAVSEQRKPPRLAMPLIPDKAAFQNSNAWTYSPTNLRQGLSQTPKHRSSLFARAQKRQITICDKGRPKFHYLFLGEVWRHPFLRISSRPVFEPSTITVSPRWYITRHFLPSDTFRRCSALSTARRSSCFQLSDE
jgi:hypothetical protein